MYNDESDIPIKCFSEEGITSRDIVKKVKNLGISVSQSTIVRVIENETKNGKQNLKNGKWPSVKNLEKLYMQKTFKKFTKTK